MKFSTIWPNITLSIHHTCKEVFLAAIAALCGTMSVGLSDTHPSENAILITLYQVDKHPREKFDRPCNVIVGVVITVEPCQKMFRYADIHPF